MAEITPPRPLAETDERSGFDCGRESMNQWFRRHAWTNHAAGISRTNVICNTETARIVGYVTLSAGQVERPCCPSRSSATSQVPTLRATARVRASRGNNGFP